MSDDELTRAEAVARLRRISESIPSGDPVNHPAHYMAFPGVEVIQITEHLSFCAGSAVKYLCRAGLKDPAKTVEDLEKARWYVEREIARVKSKKTKEPAA